MLSSITSLSGALLALSLLLGLVSADTIPDLSLRAAATSGNSSCAALQAALPPGRVFYPASTQYTSSLADYYAAQESALQPNCFVRPTCTSDVSTIVKVLGQAYKRDHSNQFAIKSGGHMYWAGAANINHGVTIDLGRLNATTLASDKKTAVILPGSQWIDVYRSLAPSGVYAVGGRTAQVGVGGLTVGGGISWFSPKQGFACDNVKDFEIVLADGSVTHANSKQNSDLWLALKGGSSNFGIVTAFTVYTYPLTQLWGGQATYLPTTTPQQLKALSDLDSVNYDESASVIQTYLYTNAEGTPLNIVVNNLIYTQPTPYPKTFAPFTSIPSLSSTFRLDTLPNFSSELGATTVDGSREFGITVTIENDLTLLTETVALFQSSLASVAAVQNLTYLMGFEPFPPAVTSKALLKGNDVLGLSNNQKPLFNILFQAIWASESDDAVVVGSMKNLYQKVSSAAAAKGELNKYQYLNYADVSQDPIASYGRGNQAFLQSVSVKYDPSGFWQRASPGGFKVF